MPAIGNIDELKLTQKQESFCLAYVETGNASEAYRRAYNAGKMKSESVNVNASKLLAGAKISLRVAGLKADLVERHQITADDIAKMLREDRDSHANARRRPLRFRPQWGSQSSTA
jgi:phage terminase small subunit